MVETSLPVKWVGAAVRWLLFFVRANKIGPLERILFRTFFWKLEEKFKILEEEDRSPDGFTHNHYMAKIEVMMILDKFRIPHPEETDDTVMIWLHFLALVIPACKLGNLNTARGIMYDPSLRFRAHKERRNG